MQPEEAVRQVQCVANVSLEEMGERVAPMYRPTFRRVSAEGTGADVTRLADKLCAEIRAGDRPTVVDAEDVASGILRRRRAVTDGGQP